MTEQFQAMPQGVQPDTRPMSILAITSLVLGILFLCLGPLGFLPLGLGIFAITKTGVNGPKRGMGLAIAGTSLGGVGVLGTCLTAGIMLPALGAAQEAAQRVVSQSNMREMVQGAIVYADGHEDQFPTQDQWPTVLVDSGLVDIEVLDSPAEDGDGISYIYFGGQSTMDANQIVLYEDPKHFERGVLVAFADGHVEFIDHDTFGEMLAEQLGGQSGQSNPPSAP